VTDTLESLRRKIGGAGELESVVRTMKVLAASSIGQYERAVPALAEYYRTLELGLWAYFNQAGVTEAPTEEEAPAGDAVVNVVVFGSDQGLVGQFNEVLADFVLAELEKLPGERRVWAVGERMHDRLLDTGLPEAGLLAVPNSVAAITPLVSRILVGTEASRAKGEAGQLYIFHNRPKTGAIHEPVSQRLLPLDEKWRRDIAALRWPTRNPPEVLHGGDATLLALVGEYLFVSLFKACAESLASEHASRLAAMQRAEQNIGELLEDLGLTFNRLRQSSIDEELFEVVSGFEALTGKRGRT
jgi:F-type H+-transporting ATPase subunit gamma